jgi:hypothetical protein
VTSSGSAALVRDEHVTRAQGALQERGIDARRVHDFDAKSQLDPDVIRKVARFMDRPWVLVTLDGGLIKEAPRFEWERYAIAWVVLPPHVKGVAAERAKMDVVQRHAHHMIAQQPGDHYSYTRRARFRHPPALITVRARF